MNKQQAQTLWILFLALLSSVVMYVVVAVLVDSQGGPQGVDQGAFDLELLQYVFLGLGAVATVASLVIPGLVIRSEPDEVLPFQRLFTKKILQWALAESIAIFGLLLYFLTGDLGYTYIFAAWSAIIMLFHGPFGLAHSERRP
jgi:F0F1-type ATP synthase membrane subunit c/vacuolar-type H+-ATPase subunit K